MSVHIQEEAGVLYLPDNLSDHSPIFCKVKIEEIEEKNIEETMEKPPKLNWNKQARSGPAK